MFGLFKKKDPICGMKQEKDKGMIDGGNWFCSQNCKIEFNKKKKSQEKEPQKKKGCCG